MARIVWRRTDIIPKIQAFPIPLPVEHYENFPVASWLLPPALRPPVEAIYAFARSADDFADEGDRPDAERLALLDGYARLLDSDRSPGAPRPPGVLAPARCYRGARPATRTLPRPPRRLPPGRGEEALCHVRRVDGLLPAFGQSGGATSPRPLPQGRLPRTCAIPTPSARACNSSITGRTSPSTGARDASTCRRRISGTSTSTSAGLPKAASRAAGRT